MGREEERRGGWEKGKGGRGEGREAVGGGEGKGGEEGEGGEGGEEEGGRERGRSDV